MIVGYSNDRKTLKFESYSGERFDMECGYRRMTVPRRGDDGKPETVIFNLTRLFEDNVVPVGTTADEVYAAIGVIESEMLPCSERARAIFLLKKYLQDTKQQRCNQYLLELGALYETRFGLILYDAVGNNEFRFPAYYIREKEVAKLVNTLLQYPGTASSCAYMPRNWDMAVRCTGIYGGNRAHCAIIKLRRELHLDNPRVEAAFVIARYLETHR